MLVFPGRQLLPALLVVVLSGCAGSTAVQRSLPDADLVVELTETPFFPQRDYQCGPAALATVLQTSGVDVTPADLAPTVYTPGRRGSLQVDMLAATRAAGRVPYVLDGTLSAVAGELRAGRPVVVLQNLGIASIPRWHYAVVVGVDVPRGHVVLRSGTQRRRETAERLFLRTWERGEHWALTVLNPGEFPENVDRKRYLTAVAGLEEVGKPAEAARFYRAALSRWPGDTTARFGLGNALLADGKPAAAEKAFRALLAARPGVVVARNNLAIALRDQGKLNAALVEIDRALAEASDSSLVNELRDTRSQIERAVSEAGNQVATSPSP